MISWLWPSLLKKSLTIQRPLTSNSASTGSTSMSIKLFSKSGEVLPFSFMTNNWYNLFLPFNRLISDPSFQVWALQINVSVTLEWGYEGGDWDRPVLVPSVPLFPGVPLHWQCRSSSWGCHRWVLLYFQTEFTEKYSSKLLDEKRN